MLAPKRHKYQGYMTQSNLKMQMHISVSWDRIRMKNFQVKKKTNGLDDVLIFMRV